MTIPEGKEPFDLGRQVVAVKGIGGFHLVCNARNAATVARLRGGKQREEKPFAVMVLNAVSARHYAQFREQDGALLETGERPSWAAKPESSEPTDGDTSEQSDAHEPEVEMPKPRRAVRLDLPLERDEVAWPPDRSRLNRRNMYRVLDRFGWRDDLT